MTLHTYTPQPMSLPSMNFLHLTVSEIQPGQTISRLPAHPDTMGENNTPTALKGCGVKIAQTNKQNRLKQSWSSHLLFILFNLIIYTTKKESSSETVYLCVQFIFVSTRVLLPRINWPQA